MGDHLAVAARAKGKAPAVGPRLPAEVAYIWGVYSRLDGKRSSGFNVGPITYTEMVSFATLHGFRWRPFEIDVIEALDRAFLAHCAEQQKPNRGV